MLYPKTKTKPWHHQIEFWNFVQNKEATYAAWGMGAGKSKMAVDIANGFNSQKIIILCPKKVIDVWPHQFKLHSHYEYKILALSTWSTQQKYNAIKQFIPFCKTINKRFVIIINYESYWRPPLGPIYLNNRFRRKGLLSSIPWDLMIADEAHRIKSPGGKASWGAKRLAKNAFRRLWLSGTPMPHSPTDLYAQFRALDENVFGTRLSKFKNDYCVMGGFEGRQTLAYKNLDDLNKKFYSISHYVNVDDALDLPDKQDLINTCDLKPKTLSVYNQLNKDFVASVHAGQITVSNALTKLLRLAQIAGGTLVLDDKNKSKQYIDSSKIDTVIELLENLPDTEPVIIFCRFRDELQRLTETINKKFGQYRTVDEISGRVKYQHDDFKDGIWHATETNTLLVQIAAGGEGIDLTAARYCFFMSIGYSLGQYQQAKARVHRPGQTKKVFYYHIIAKNTVDQQIFRAIKSKQNIVDSIINSIKQRI